MRSFLEEQREYKWRLDYWRANAGKTLVFSAVVLAVSVYLEPPDYWFLVSATIFGILNFAAWQTNPFRRPYLAMAFVIPGITVLMSGLWVVIDWPMEVIACHGLCAMFVSFSLCMVISNAFHR